jgi:gentisate 1,2-dioxygenase
MASAARAGEPVVMRYVDPTSGRPPLPTMSCAVRWLRPGETSSPERRSASAVLLVVEGRGESRIGDASFAWEPGDCLVAPPWQWLEHRNASSDAPAALFSFSDEPVLRALGLWHEERRP